MLPFKYDWEHDCHSAFMWQSVSILPGVTSHFQILSKWILCQNLTKRLQPFTKTTHVLVMPERDQQCLVPKLNQTTVDPVCHSGMHQVQAFGGFWHPADGAEGYLQCAGRTPPAHVKTLLCDHLRWEGVCAAECCKNFAIQSTILCVGILCFAGSMKKQISLISFAFFCVCVLVNTPEGSNHHS